MPRALFSLAAVLVLSATLGGAALQAGDGPTGTAASATGSGGDEHRPLNPAIKADLQALKSARKQFKDDRENHDADRLTADREAVKAAIKKLREDIAAARKVRKSEA